MVFLVVQKLPILKLIFFQIIGFFFQSWNHWLPNWSTLYGFSPCILPGIWLTFGPKNWSLLLIVNKQLKNVNKSDLCRDFLHPHLKLFYLQNYFRNSFLKHQLHMAFFSEVVCVLLASFGVEVPKLTGKIVSKHLQDVPYDTQCCQMYWFHDEQCGNLRIFLSLILYLKTISSDGRSTKNCHFCTFDSSDFWFLEFFNEFWQFLGAKIYQNQNLHPTKLKKKKEFELPETARLISRKIWVASKSSIFDNINMWSKYLRSKRCQILTQNQKRLAAL